MPLGIAPESRAIRKLKHSVIRYQPSEGPEEPASCRCTPARRGACRKRRCTR